LLNGAIEGRTENIKKLQTDRIKKQKLEYKALG
jgi:hypothetical protein